MDQPVPNTTQVVSPEAYGLILTSRPLRELLLPEGPRVSPYEVLDYRATLTLHDEWGSRATFRRSQQVRFLQDGVGGILDHAWGEGNLLASYRHSAGKLVDSFRDHERLHLVVELGRRQGRGDVMMFSVEREAIDAYSADTGVIETVIDHPIRSLTRSVVFPETRPVYGAVLEYDGQRFPLPMLRRTDGRTEVSFHMAHPQADTPYTIFWSW